AFGERFLQRLDRIAVMQLAEGRRERQRAGADRVDRMALRAVGAREDEAALLGRGERQRGVGAEREEEGGGEGAFHAGGFLDAFLPTMRAARLLRKAGRATSAAGLSGKSSGFPVKDSGTGGGLDGLAFNQERRLTWPTRPKSSW